MLHINNVTILNYAITGKRLRKQTNHTDLVVNTNIPFS